MAKDYKITLSIEVQKDPIETLIQSEDIIFTKLSFATMSHAAAEFYELITKLTKSIK